METKRGIALMDLKRLAENLQKCKVALPDRAWIEELEQMCIWANNDGTKSCLPEIHTRIEAIKTMVCE